MGKLIGKIVKIINDYEIVVSRESELSLNVGDAVIVLGETLKIHDPNTNIEYGEYRQIKETLEIIHVQAKFIVCSKIVAEERSPFALNHLETKTVRVKKKLNVNEAQNEHFEFTDKKISLNDEITLK